jgi:signal peptidase I
MRAIPRQNDYPMSALTAILYAALVVYLGGWYADQWIGNFSLLLFVLTVVTLGYWVAERFHFKPAREAAASALESQQAQRRAELAGKGITQVDGNVQLAKERALAQPWWLDWTAGLFPVILVVFLLRSFLFEPFKIPSGSMVPTLMIGDLILVNKYHYGVRLPVMNRKVIASHNPQRGDVVVFRYPVDPRVDYIKRVVGVPGDEVAYLNQKLSINGQAVNEQPQGEYYDDDSLRYAPQFLESLGSVQHRILVDPKRNAYYGIAPVSLCTELPLFGRGRCVQGSRGPLLHDGRQPRQFAGFAVLGFRTRREHRWQGLLRLDEFR